MTSNNDEQVNRSRGAAVESHPRRPCCAREAEVGEGGHLGKRAAQKPKGRQGFKVWRWAPVRAVKRLRSSPY
jgi:hypothetical protein